MKLKYLFLSACVVVATIYNTSAQSSSWGKYTLLAPEGTSASLVDLDGNAYITWSKFSTQTAYSSYLLPGGSIVRTCKPTSGSNANLGGSTGRVEIVDKSGNVTWSYENTYLHHDICVMPNGNLLLIIYDPRTSTEITQAGGSSSSQGGMGGMGGGPGQQSSSSSRYFEKILEINPSTNETVWEWYLWDHLCQNSNSSYDNYVSSISEHPELMNINYNTSNSDWFHMNGIDYNEYRDQIIFSSHYMNEVYVIDHSTTTAEAATHEGGTYGHGGDFLFRWGNPAAYGLSGTTNFNVVHDGHMGAQGTPYENTLVGYNNKGGSNNKSAVDRINIKENDLFSDDANTTFVLSTTEMTPSTYDWRYQMTSSNESKGSSQELPNGNTLVCNTSYIYEVASDGSTIVWSKSSGSTPKAYRYSECYVNDEIPTTPSITASGDVLTCVDNDEADSETSYQWFLNSYMISGATSKTYTATTSGYYQVQIRNSDDCYSHISAKYYHTMSAESVMPTSVSVSLENATMYDGETITATATVLPTNATNTAVSWTSSDESIATVSADGTITAVGIGTVTITATSSADVTLSGSATLTISPITETAISTNYSNVTVQSGAESTISVTFNPTNTTYKDLSFDYDANYVSVTYDEETGNITITGIAVTESTTITITSHNGKITTIDVTVSCPTISLPTELEIPSVTMCSNDAQPFVATYSDNTLSTRWYQYATGGFVLFTGNSYEHGLTESTTIYAAKYTSEGCESARLAVSLTVNEAPAPTIQNLNTAYCQDASAVTLKASVLGGTFTIDGIEATKLTPSELSAGTHVITYNVTDANGCEGSASQDVTINTLPTIDFSETITEICNYASQQELVASPANGTWSGSGVSDGYFNPSTVSAGNYTITYTVTDENSCSATSETSILVNDSQVVTIQDLHSAYCQNADEVTLVASIDGGTFTIDGDVVTTLNPSSLSATTHTIEYTTTDENGCETSASQTITINSLPTIDFSTTTTAICENANTTQLSAKPLGGVWSGSGVSEDGNFTPSSVSTDVANLTYTYTDANNCTSTSSVDITINSIPTIDFTSTLSEICKNADAQTLVATPSDGSWSGTGVSGNSFNPTNLSAGSYEITYTYTDENSCSTTETTSIEVIVASNPTVQSATIQKGSATIPALTAEGSAISWYESESSTTPLATGNSYTPSVSTNSETTYTYYVSNTENGCESERVAVTLTITSCETEAPTNPSNETICQEESIPALTATGSNLKWYDSASSSVVLSNEDTYTPSDVENAGTYTYYVSQTIGCESPRTAVTLTVESKPSTITIASTDAVCQNEAITFTTVGTNVIWYDATTNEQIATGNSYSPSSENVGTISVYATQTIGNCTSNASAIASVTIKETPAQLIINGIEDMCQNTTASVLTTEGTNVTWYDATTNEQIATGNSYTPSTTTIGTYSVYAIQTVNGCASDKSASSSFSVSSLPTKPTISGTSVVCQNGNITLMSNTSVTWYDATTNTELATGTNYSSTATNAGTYAVYAIQIVGECVSEQSETYSYTVNATPAKVVISGIADVCQDENDETLTTIGTNVIWYDATNDKQLAVGSSYTPNTSVAGEYSVYATQTVNGCTSDKSEANSFTIYAIPDKPIISSTTYCLGDEYTISATGSNIEWTNAQGVVLGTNSTLNVTDISTANTYTYYATQTVNGCKSASANGTITVKANPTVTFNAVDELCSNATVSVSLYTAVSPLGGSFSGDITTASIIPANLGEGTFFVTYTVTDNGCSSSASQFVTITSCEDNTDTESSYTNAQFVWFDVDSDIVLTSGTSIDLSQYIATYPEETDAQLVKWISYTKSIATVDENGVVTAMNVSGEKTVTIVAIIENPDGTTLNTSIEITVVEKTAPEIVGGNVRFAVDMTGQEINNPKLLLYTPDEDNAEAITLSREGTTNVYSVILDLPTNALYSYYFSNSTSAENSSADFYTVESLTDEQSEACISYFDNGDGTWSEAEYAWDGTYLRWVYVTDFPETYDAEDVQYGKNAPQGDYTLRFRVNTSNIDVCESGLYIYINNRFYALYSFLDDVYEAVIYLPAGTYEYTLFNGANIVSTDVETQKITLTTDMDMSAITWVGVDACEKITPDAIKELSTSFNISVIDRNIIIENEQNEDVTIYNIDGQCMYAAKAVSYASAMMPKVGTYIITVGNQKQMVIVR